MTSIDRLAEKHFREHESRLHRIDELIEKHQKAAADKPEAGQLLGEIKEERDHLASYLEDLKRTAPEKWMEQGGPMVMWDIVAQRLEDLVEKIEH